MSKSPAVEETTKDTRKVTKAQKNGYCVSGGGIKLEEKKDEIAKRRHVLLWEY
jgi:hypothetical protein